MRLPCRTLLAAAFASLLTLSAADLRALDDLLAGVDPSIEG